MVSSPVSGSAAPLPSPANERSNQPAHRDSPGRLRGKNRKIVPWLAVVVAAVLGSELRFGLGLLFPESHTGFPGTTLTINCLGALALGILTGFWSVRPAAFWLRAALGPGFLGSFTTFSAIVLAVDSLSGAGLLGLAILYLAITLAAGLTCAALGLFLVSAWARRTARRGTQPEQNAIGSRPSGRQSSENEDRS